ncbi:hypothetical protein M885DRAFT_511506 [Pelagophyceae sp. CCMP2097]|nr:hypothetical protein M885DRAFT_511506 [Pelagophyceae sp. CCMP2097]
MATFDLGAHCGADYEVWLSEQRGYLEEGSSTPVHFARAMAGKWSAALALDEERFGGDERCATTVVPRDERRRRLVDAAIALRKERLETAAAAAAETARLHALSSRVAEKKSLYAELERAAAVERRAARAAYEEKKLLPRRPDRARPRIKPTWKPNFADVQNLVDEALSRAMSSLPGSAEVPEDVDRTYFGEPAMDFSDRDYLKSVEQHLATNDIMLEMMASRNARRDEFREALRAPVVEAEVPENLDYLL